MNKDCYGPYVKCGRVFQPDLPNQLDQSQPPIILAEVFVDTVKVERPCVVIKFSEFINFTVVGLDSKLSIIYRLVREEEAKVYPQILQEWQFEFDSALPLEISNVASSQPTVLSYCDCLDKDDTNKLTYRIEIVEIKTNNVRNYDITNKSIIANVLYDQEERKKTFSRQKVYYNKLYYNKKTGLYDSDKDCNPFVQCGKVFNPVLPLQLSREAPPVVLAEVKVDIDRNVNKCVLVDFSAFLTSILKGENFNSLTFRLVKTCSDYTRQVLREWPFRRAFVNNSNIKEPIVYDYCDCFKSKINMSCTYTFEIVEANLSQQSYYAISQKSMTALVYCGKNQQGSC
ncbi:DUF4489 domain-containing protein [Alkaliphilus hydrothermalis]|uniref:SipL SPOCS domain-containing protein n=1 Tax=Alkaliphilus hydrothermalis TaxID=1482730 RepID=A0ABS2NSW2_9FIRM|nr:DUF4489 domain-containing protein [Alkaliphilus hydrothermalis]MBM7616049.1 hypothetical protein [Alkaliphilus hydrothermalis]